MARKYCDELKLNIVAVILTVKIVNVKYSFVPITELTIIDFIDFNFMSLSKKTFANNVTGITFNLQLACKSSQ